MESGRHLALGESGEDLACAALERRGYAILERRYRTRVGEIDIVARDGDVLVFVEVKTRRTVRYGHPAEAVTPEKRRRVALMAADYLARRRPRASACRFDVVAVTIGVDGPPRVEVIPGAFSVGE
jgi:putative endonuclease